MRAARRVRRPRGMRHRRLGVGVTAGAVVLAGWAAAVDSTPRVEEALALAGQDPSAAIAAAAPADPAMAAAAAAAALPRPARLTGRAAVAGARVRVADRTKVVERPADQSWGSGLQYPYGGNAHSSSAPTLIAAAAADPAGCLIAGDSVAMEDFGFLADALAGAKGARCVHDGWPGRRTEGTTDALADMWLHEGLPPRIVVLAGANDVFNPPEFEAEARRLLTVTAGVPRVLWVTPFVSRRPVTINTPADERNSRFIRDVIVRLVGEYPNLVVVPWEEYFDHRPDRMAAYLPDGIHPNAAGQRILAGMIADRW